MKEQIHVQCDVIITLEHVATEHERMQAIINALAVNNCIRIVSIEELPENLAVELSVKGEGHGRGALN